MIAPEISRVRRAEVLCMTEGGEFGAGGILGHREERGDGSRRRGVRV